MAFVEVIHLLGVSVKLFEPASFLKASNSMPLKSGLCNSSHKPINSIVLRLRLLGDVRAEIASAKHVLNERYIFLVGSHDSLFRALPVPAHGAYAHATGL